MFNCCLDLTDNELELKIIRGLNYQTPAGFDNNSFQTYVKFEFPYPVNRFEIIWFKFFNNYKISRKKHKVIKQQNKMEIVQVFY